MRRIAAVFWLLPLAILFSQSVSAATLYFRIADGAATAPVENACPVWIREINEDDCTYNESNAADPPLPWIGPVFSAAYYAPGDAPPVYQSTPAPAPVTEPAREDALFVNPVIGIPIARAFISIDDRGTPGGTDDQIGGTIEFGAFERNISTDLSGRVVESFDRVIHRLAPFTVSSATPNVSGGFDYVVGATPTTATTPSTPGFPGLLSGSTTSNGGFSDDFPSEIASQSSPNSADASYWGAAGANGIASFEGATRLIGTTTSATAWGYSCNAGSGAGSCVTNGLLGGSNGQASLENVLLRFSTDSSGNLTAADAFLVNYSDLSTTVTGNDSWQATTLSFTGAQTQVPLGFDDRVVFQSGNPNLTSVTANVLLNDLPGLEPVTMASITQPADGTAEIGSGANANRIVYTPSTANPPDSEQVIDYQFTDANGMPGNATLHVLVSDPVQCTNDSADADRNTPETVDVLLNDSGFNVAPVILSITGVSRGTAVVNADRTITFTPPQDEGGPFTIGYRISDGAGSATCQLGIQIDAIPVAQDDDIDVENEVATTLEVVDNDDDAFDSPLTLEVTVEPIQGIYFIIPASGDRAPLIRYTPAAGYLGTDSLSYELTDADGDFSEATVTINVIDSVPEPADDPAITDPPEPILAEDAVETLIDVLANDEKLADGPVIITITTPPANGTVTVEPAAANTGGYVKYTSTAGFEGDDTFSYTVTDADGDVSVAAATVTVNVADSVPAADDDIFNGSARAFDVMRVWDGDTVTGDRPVTIEITQQPTLGVARVKTTGSGAGAFQDIEYQSNADSAGSDTVKYRLHDADGSVSGVATVAIAVTNDTPAVVDDGAYSIEDGLATSLNVLANDTGTGNRLLTITITQQPSNGSVAVVAGTATSNPTVTYTPASGYTGADTFRYSLRDADGDTSPADALVSVTVVDSVPQATDDTRNGSSRDPVDIDVLFNDTLVDLPVTMEITQQPTLGTATPVTITRANGTTWPGISYASDLDSSGTDTITYTVTDRDGDTDEGTLTLTVENETPVAEDDAGEDAEDGLIVNPQQGQDLVIEHLKTQFDVLYNDTGLANSPLTLTITQQPANGTGTAIIELPEDTGFGRPVISFQGDVGYIGPASFAYTVTDADGDASDAATVSFDIISFPTATYDGAPSPLRTNQEMPITINVLDNDGGLAYGPVTVAIVGDAVHGTAVVNPDNTITFTPEPGFTGRFPSPECPQATCFSSEGAYFQYSITDSYNQVSQGYAFVDVFPGPVVDSGSSSSLDIELLALLAAGGVMRRRLRRGSLVEA